MSSLPMHTPSGHRLFTWRDWSVLVPVRPIIAALGLALALAVVSVVSLAVGSAGLTPMEAFRALFGEGTKADVFVVQELRWPRLMAGLLVGAALGIGGCLVQTLARNRLATPNTVGIDNGATAFAVASVVSVSTSFAPSAMALVGAATAAALALGLSGGTGTRGYRFIVVGIGVGALFQAGTSLILARAPIDAANAAYTWTVGSLNARSPQAVTLLAIGMVICAPLALILANRLSLMRLPDAVAQGLGVSVNLVRLGTLIVAVVLAALAIAVAGPIGMVALVGPEAARRLAGPRGVPVVSAALAGALITVLADTAGRTLFDPIEVPVGVITAVVGGPYLIWILLRDQPRRVP